MASRHCTSWSGKHNKVQFGYQGPRASSATKERMSLQEGGLQTFKAYAKTKHQYEWRHSSTHIGGNEAGLRHSKLFIEGNSGWTKKLWKSSRKQLRIISGVFTGHLGVKDLLAKMGLSDSLDSRMCGEEDETMEHLLWE
jgi:hypothetical protein